LASFLQDPIARPARAQRRSRVPAKGTAVSFRHGGDTSASSDSSPCGGIGEREKDRKHKRIIFTRKAPFFITPYIFTDSDENRKNPETQHHYELSEHHGWLPGKFANTIAAEIELPRVGD